MPGGLDEKYDTQREKLAGRSQINRANNSIDIALGASIKVLGGFTLTVREKGVEV